jgi:hypothetical protein
MRAEIPTTAIMLEILGNSANGIATVQSICEFCLEIPDNRGFDDGMTSSFTYGFEVKQSQSVIISE